MTDNENLDYLNKYMIPKFFDIKSNKTSHETLYNSSDGTNLISGYISLDNSDKHFYTHICYHTMKLSLELLIKNNTNKPSTIVETGCSTNQGTKSTTLWDMFVNKYGGNVYSVDLNKHAVLQANQMTSDNTLVTCKDSVEYLQTFTQPIDFYI